MPFVPLIFDSFTDVPGTNIRLHVPDTGGIWWTNIFGPICVINPTGDKARATGLSGSIYMLSGGGGGAVQNIGDEIFADIRRSDGPLSYHSCSLLYLMNGVDPLDHYYRMEVHFDFNTNDVEIDMWRWNQGVETVGPITLPGTFLWPQTTSLRIGVTIKGDDEHEVWYEPVGGGARTIFGTWTPAPSVNFTGWVGDSIHKWIGFNYVVTFFETVRTEVDNLTFQHFIAGVGPITGLDFMFSVNNPVNDIAFSGGAVSTGIIFDGEYIIGCNPTLKDNESWWWIKSDNVLDDREVTLYGKTQSGALRQDKLTLNGTDYIISKLELSRITMASVNQVSATDEITIGRALRTGIKPTALIDIPKNFTFRSIPFKNSRSDEIEQVVRYEKMHFRNGSSEDFVGLVAVMNVEGTIDGTLQIATEPTVNTTDLIENRLQVPSGITFVDAGVPLALPTPLIPGDAATIWIKQTLGAGQVIQVCDALAKINVDGSQPIGGPVAGDYTFLVEPAINIFKKEFSF